MNGWKQLKLNSNQNLEREVKNHVSFKPYKSLRSIFWPSDAKNWLTGKDPDAGKYRRQEEKGTTGD